jgi:hypothetical protein
VLLLAISAHSFNGLRSKALLLLQMSDQASLSGAAIARLNGDDKQIRMVAGASDVTNLR